MAPVATSVYLDDDAQALLDVVSAESGKTKSGYIRTLIQGAALRARGPCEIALLTVDGSGRTRIYEDPDNRSPLPIESLASPDSTSSVLLMGTHLSRALANPNRLKFWQDFLRRGRKLKILLVPKADGALDEQKRCSLLECLAVLRATVPSDTSAVQAREIDANAPYRLTTFFRTNGAADIWMQPTYYHEVFSGDWGFLVSGIGLDSSMFNRLMRPVEQLWDDAREISLDDGGC